VQYDQARPGRMLGVSLPGLCGRHHAGAVIYDGEMMTFAQPGSGSDAVGALGLTGDPDRLRLPALAVVR
jgi:hypothetical protein